MNLHLRTEGFLLAATGEGSAMLDAEASFTPEGFPVFPARRLKGLLRESLQEVLEMKGIADDTIQTQLECLFGNKGLTKKEGKLVFHNLHIPDHAAVLEALKGKRKSAPHAFSPHAVKEHYSSKIQQTAIETDGVAKDKSLRVYSVLNPGIELQGSLEKREPLTEDELGLLKKALLNLRFAGTRRNKGFGKVRVWMDAEDTTESTGGTANTGTMPLDETDHALHVRITTRSEVVLAMLEGEQNTVSTYKTLSGNMLRGLLAGLYIQQNKVDDTFHKLFLSGNLHFSVCHPQGCFPLPLNIHQERGTDTQLDVFAKADLQSKVIGGLGRLQGNIYKKVPTPTVFNFHTTRKKRSAGRSTSDEEGGIFYYEALAPGSVLEGRIAGMGAKSLKSLFGSSFTARMGKSRSAQYGQVLVEFMDMDPSKAQMDLKTDAEKGQPNAWMLYCKSPLILLNEHGEAEPDVASLLLALGHGVGERAVQVLNAATQVRQVEMYNSVWESKSSKMAAFAEGSVFEIAVSPAADAGWLGGLNKHGLGAMRNLGFGEVVVCSKAALPLNLVKGAELPRNPESPSAVNQAPYSGDILNAIQLAAEKRRNESLIKTRAIQGATKDLKAKQLAAKLSNHLISRLIELFHEVEKMPAAIVKDEFRLWAKWTEDGIEPAVGTEQEMAIRKTLRKWMSPKAIESLKGADLIREFKNIDRLSLVQKAKEGDPAPAHNAVLWWLSYLQTMRRIKKQKD